MIKLGRLLVKIIPLSLLLVLAGTSLVSGSVTQWFPTEGTTCDYQLSYSVTKTNGVRETYTTFDVYNTSSTYMAIYPTFLRHQKSGIETGIKNATVVYYRHSYTENTVSDWRRTTRLVIDGIAYTRTQYRGFNTNTTFHYISNADTIVPKYGFLTSLSNNFIDHFNCSLKIGDRPFFPYNLTAITSDRLIATYNISYAPAYGFYTYVADLSGRVLALDQAYYDPAYASAGILTTQMTYKLEQPASEIPPPSNPFANIDGTTLILFGAAAGMGVVIGALLGFSAGKKKRA